MISEWDEAEASTTVSNWPIAWRTKGLPLRRVDDRVEADRRAVEIEPADGQRHKVVDLVQKAGLVVVNGPRTPPGLFRYLV